MDAESQPSSELARSKIKLPSQRRSKSRTATRALDVLELFGLEQRPLRAVEIAKALGLGGSSADQLLKTMVNSGHLVFEAGRKSYRPSHRFIAFASWIAASYGTDDRLRRLVNELHVRSGLSVTLTAPNDLFMQIVDMAMSTGEETERGLQVSIFETALGSAYLSTLTDSEALALARRAGLADDQIAALPASLAEIRAKGFVDPRSIDNLRWTMAVPLPPGRFPIPLILGLSGSADNLLPYRATFAQMMFDAIQLHLQVDRGE